MPLQEKASDSPALLVDDNTTPGVLHLTLNTPSKLNALTPSLLISLTTALTAASSNEHIHAVIISSSSTRAFCAGADINHLQTLNGPSAYACNYLYELKSAFRRCRIPVIAAVNGLALGGGFELALLCDIMIGSDDVQFAFPETTLGTIPGGGGTQRVMAAVGRSVAYEMVLTGRRLGAEEAVRCGLVCRIVGRERLVEECLEIGKKIAQADRNVVMMGKQALRFAETSTEKGDELESALYHLSMAGDTFQRRTSEFVERRRARKEGNSNVTKTTNDDSRN